MQQNMEIIIKIFEVLIMITVVIFCRKVKPFLDEYVKPTLQNATAERYLKEAKTWAEMAVKAVEQVSSPDVTGEQKKRAVANFLHEVVDAAGATITPEQIDILIEAAVRQLKIEKGEKKND